MKTYDNIKKISTRQGDNYTTGCQLDYLYFREHYEMIAKKISKPKELGANPKAIQQNGNTTMIFIL